MNKKTERLNRLIEILKIRKLRIHQGARLPTRRVRK